MAATHSKTTTTVATVATQSSETTRRSVPPACTPTTSPMVTQRYFKREILERFLTAEEMRDFNHAYIHCSHRHDRKHIKTYQRQVMGKFLSGSQIQELNERYQESKVPTAQNLHYGKDMETIIKRVTIKTLKEYNLI